MVNHQKKASAREKRGEVIGKNHPPMDMEVKRFWPVAVRLHCPSDIGRRMNNFLDAFLLLMRPFLPSTHA